VEMAGIEPASERLDPRISTSVVGCSRSSASRLTDQTTSRLAARTLKPA